MNKTCRNKSGFNLIEAAIVLAIVGLVIGGIWIAASRVSFQQTVSSTSANIVAIISNAQRIFPAYQNLGWNNTLLNQTAISAGVIPADYVTSASTFSLTGTDMWRLYSSGSMNGVSRTLLLQGSVSSTALANALMTHVVNGAGRSLVYAECRRPSSPTPNQSWTISSGNYVKSDSASGIFYGVFNCPTEAAGTQIMFYFPAQPY